MIHETVETPIAAGAVKGRFFRPEGAGPWPLVVFYMDAFGLRPSLSEMAHHLVDAGYALLQPDLYWRQEPYDPFDPSGTFDDPDERERIMSLIHSVQPEDVVADTRLLVDEVTENHPVKSQEFGCVGYCMGGRMAFVVAQKLSDRVVAVASIHGGGLVTEGPDSPHLGVSSIRAIVYLGVADQDRSCTAEHQQTLRAALEDADVDYTLELYSGARHGFAVPDLPVYDADAADRHWDRVLSLFDAELRGARS